jgi:hypothetical protein
VQLCLGHALAVEERSVGAALVDHEPVDAPPFDEGVFAGDGAVADHDLAAGIPADKGLVLVEIHPAAAGGGRQPQVGHGIAPPRWLLRL